MRNLKNDLLEQLYNMDNKVTEGTTYLEDNVTLSLSSIREWLYSVVSFLQVAESPTSWWFLGAVSYVAMLFLGTLVICFYGYSSVREGFALLVKNRNEI